MAGSSDERVVVLPRGLNVGAGNRVKMPELTSALTDAGGRDVDTILQSGNILLRTDDGDPETARALVADTLRDSFNIDVHCEVRTAAEISAIFVADPLGPVADDSSRYVVTFLSGVPSADAVADLSSDNHGLEQFRVVGREAYVWAPEGLQNLKLSYSFFERHFDLDATSRNWRTVGKIAGALGVS